MYFIHKKFLCSILSILSVFTGLAKVKLPSIISDNMVFQEQVDAPIWGWASPGEQIDISTSWTNKHFITTANDHGNWEIGLKTPKAGGPYSLKIEASNSITIKNILIGEVWLCSGQSNMEMPVEGWENQPVKNSKAEIEKANFPDIRIFTVKKKTSLSPLQDTDGTWQQVTPETIKEFSATAYFFGKNLHQHLNVPVGLIHSSWGGTVAEAWTSEKALRKLKDFNDALDDIDQIKSHKEEVIAQDSLNIWEFNNKIATPTQQYSAAEYQDDSWESLDVPSIWEKQGHPDFDGIVWYRKSIVIPENWEGRELKLFLGPIDDIDITWFNGNKVGETKREGFYWAKERVYTIPGNLVKKGKNEIAVRVVDFTGSGGIYGEKDKLQLKLSDNSSDQSIALSGDWKFKTETRTPKIKYSENPNRPAALYNGMIAPIVPFSIKGVIWYQGESNVGRADQYMRLFPLMIRNWRHVWRQKDFPFYFAQIAPFGYMGDGSESAKIRDVQRRTVKEVKNTGMAVLLDIGSSKTIHPPNKEEVGRRLSLLALNHTYHKNVISSGPIVNKLKIKGGKAVVSFKNVQGGLVAKADSFKNFELAGIDGEFYPAKAHIDHDKIIVYSENVSKPVTVRYAWRDQAVAEIFNSAGLPASTFQISKKD